VLLKVVFSGRVSSKPLCVSKMRVNMTLITGFTNNQKSFIISDLRLTKNVSKTQFDRTLKFIPLDKRIGIFPSGDVDFWIATIPKLNSIISSVTYDNIADIDEPFWQELSIAAGEYSGNISRAICFILNSDTKKHRLLKIIVEPGKGARIIKFNNKQTEIIGSGAYIPNLKNKLDSRYEQANEFYKGELYGIASSFRSEILNQINKLGSNAYKKLGISPIMILSILDKDYFYISGEVVEGGNYSTNNIYTYKYEFSKNGSEDIKLKNLDDGAEFQLIDINNLHLLSDDDEIFDPAKLTEGFDPSIHFKTYSHVYLLEQAVFPKMTGDMSNHIFRCIDKIEFITKHRLCKSIELNRHSLENIEDVEFSKYQATDKIYFSLEPEKENLFLADLSTNKLFDHQWLSNFIPKYYDKIYTNT
jgi:hypothetical protein